MLGSVLISSIIWKRVCTIGVNSSLKEVPLLPFPTPTSTCCLGVSGWGRRVSGLWEQRSFPDHACYCTRSLLLVLPAYLGISQWKMGVSGPAEKESSSPGHLFLSMFPIRLTSWWCQVHVVLSERVWGRNEPTWAVFYC